MSWVAGEEVLACSLPTAEEAVRVCVERFTAEGFRQGQPVGRALTFLRPVEAGNSALSRILRRPRPIERTLVLVDDDLRGIVVRVCGPMPDDLAEVLASGHGPTLLAEPMRLDLDSNWNDMLAGRPPRDPDPSPGRAHEAGPADVDPAPDPAGYGLFDDGAPESGVQFDGGPPEDPFDSGTCESEQFSAIGFGEAEQAREDLPVGQEYESSPESVDLRYPRTVPRVILRPDWGEPLEAAIWGLIGRAPRPGPDPQPGQGTEPQILRVLDPELSVSKTHMAFGIDHQGLWIEDQNSTNGTAIVGSQGLALRCTPWQRYLVPDGARVVIGRRSFLVEVLRSAHRETCTER